MKEIKNMHWPPNEWITTSFPSLDTTLVVVVQVKQRKEMNKLLPIIVHMGDFGHMGKWKKGTYDTGPNSKLFRAYKIICKVTISFA